MCRVFGLALLLTLCFCVGAHAAGPKAEVIHWWTSGGEASAVSKIADAYRAGGGIWVDTAIAGSEQARAVAINRIVGGNPPTAAQFNTSKQFLDMVEQGMLNDVDEVAIKEGWDKFLPDSIRNVIKVNNHYYAAPVNIHMPAWIWYSKAAFKKAGVVKEPETMEELFAALDKLKAAGIIPLAHGGQSWQENIVFMAVLSNVGGKDLYLSIFRDRNRQAIDSDAFKKVLLAFKRLHSYVDAGAPGRNWNDATALLITGKGGHTNHGRLGQRRIYGGQGNRGQGFRLHSRIRAKVAVPDTGRRFYIPEGEHGRGGERTEVAVQCDCCAGNPTCVQQA